MTQYQVRYENHPLEIVEADQIEAARFEMFDGRAEFRDDLGVLIAAFNRVVSVKALAS